MAGASPLQLGLQRAEGSRSSSPCCSPKDWVSLEPNRNTWEWQQCLQPMEKWQDGLDAPKGAEAAGEEAEFCGAGQSGIHLPAAGRSPGIGAGMSLVEVQSPAPILCVQLAWLQWGFVSAQVSWSRICGEIQLRVIREFPGSLSSIPGTDTWDLHLAQHPKPGQSSRDPKNQNWKCRSQRAPADRGEGGTGRC